MRRLPSLFAAALGLFACSSAPTKAGGGDTTPLPTTDVYAECVDFATRLCADAKGCCQQAYGGFDAAACLSTFKREVCRPGADAVAAGHATFHEDAVDECLAAHAEAHAICVPTWQQTLELRRHIYAACRVIDGLSEPGVGCSVAASCKHPDGDATADCIKNTCQVIAILQEGEECSFPSGPVSVCDDGLACDAPGLGTSGHCVKAVATGQTCDASVLEGTDCGLGNFCEPNSAKCQQAINLGGTGCAQGNQCVSFDCDRTGNSCAPAPAVVSREACLGGAAEP